MFAQRVWSTRSTDHPGRSWLEEVDAAPFTGKAIRMARALRCLKEAIERNCTHSVSEPDSAPPVGERAKYREVQYVNRPRSVIVDGVSFGEPEVTGEAWYCLL